MAKMLLELLKKDGSARRKVISILVMTLVTAALTWWGVKTWILPMTLVLIGIGLTGVHTMYLLREQRLMAQQRQTSFISFLGIVFVFLENHFNVFQAFKESRQYVDHHLVPLLDELIDGMEVQSSSEPFLHMAHHFQSQTITQVLLLLHQLNHQGYDREIISRYQEMLMQIHNDTISSYVDSINHRFNWYYSFPLIGTVILTTFFALGVLEQVVESLYG